MKKAVLYARVSSSMQKKDKTIDSQIVALKKQISESGNILVKEYTDDGFSGAVLDRPAMNQLREDIKTKQFDTIYFLNTDRIAREVTYQTIIIAEILKHKKQIIINGKDYIHNPENKFTLTVLGAVAELERAKIIERVMRSKQLRISQGTLSGNGCFVYGYDHHRRTQTSPPAYTVNETEAKIVRWVFETYTKGDIGMNRMCQQLEERNAPTKQGRGLWRVSLIKAMLKQEMYIGIRYYNTMKRKNNKMIKRDRNEWVGVPVPVIIEKELFDKAQAKLEHNRKMYRNPRVPQMLSSLVMCGCCNGSVFANRTYYVDKRMNPPKAYNRLRYQCNYKFSKYVHAEKNRPKMRPCDNIAIKGEVLESKVFGMIEGNMFNEKKMRQCMDYFKRRTQVNESRFEKQIKVNTEKVKKSEQTKQRLIDIYTTGEIERDEYVDKSLKLDNTINKLRFEKEELLKKIPLLQKKSAVEVAVRKFCTSARARYRLCKDFDSKRQFLLEYTDRVIYYNTKVEYRGFISVKTGTADQTETAKLEFIFKDTISYTDRIKRPKGPIGGSVQIGRQEYDSVFNG